MICNYIQKKCDWKISLEKVICLNFIQIDDIGITLK